jgi:hypothetical protein
MLVKLSLAAGLVAAVATFAPHSASAGNLVPQSMAARLIDASLVQKAHYRGCRFWRHECAARWGWRTRGYFRCLWRHGC